MPEFESAIVKEYRKVGDAPLTLADLSDVAKVLIRSDRRQFDVSFGSSVVVNDSLVCGTRPGEWTLLGSTEGLASIDARIDREGFTSVIGFTHGRALVRLTGADAPRLLEKVCGLDWSDPMTPDGAVVSASVALVSCDIIRRDDAGVQSYFVMCDRSFAQYLFDALIDAGNEFGIGVA